MDTSTTCSDLRQPKHFKGHSMTAFSDSVSYAIQLFVCIALCVTLFMFVWKYNKRDVYFPHDVWDDVNASLWEYYI